MCASGSGPSQIARILKKEQILTPTMYAYTRYGITHTCLDTAHPYNWSNSAIANLLENEIYLGNTISMKHSSRSYKDKRRVEHPREECLVFENTHPALITREVWDVVQRVRKNKRRLTKMEEQSKYSGLVFCADCGSNMVLHRAHTMSASYNHFTCRTYKKDGEACTGHYIRECVLDEIVLEDLRRVTSAAREHPEKFAAYIGSKQSTELQREIRRQEKELAAIRKRKAELDAIFKKLYEDSVLGRITTEQFQMLSGSYTEEQNLITAGISQKESEIQRLRETVSGTDSFLDKAKRYTDITELTPELLRLFIEKIVVHEKEVKWSKHAPQTVEIYYNGIGYVGSGQQDVEEALEAPDPANPGRSPATSARSVPWPRPVSAKEPYNPMSAFTGGSPKRVRAIRPMRTAPAVWELEGPTIIGPRISKISSMSAPPLLHFSNFKSITVFSVLQAFSAILSMIERHPAEAGVCFWYSAFGQSST